MSLITKIKECIVTYNGNRTRPSRLFMQRFSDKTFWGYANLTPDVILQSGYDTALTHAFVRQLKQDEWGRWTPFGDVETHPTWDSENIFRILCGGNYSVKFNSERLL